MTLGAFVFQFGGGGITAFLPLVLIFVVFYFLLILPQQRKQKKWQAMLGQMKTGDRVVTNSGIRGTIVALRDDCVHLRVAPDNIRIEIMRASIGSILPSEGGETVSAK